MTTSLEATRAEHPDDAGAVGAERHADADLARPPGDAVADHAVEADRGQCQRQHPERRQDEGGELLGQPHQRQLAVDRLRLEAPWIGIQLALGGEERECDEACVYTRRLLHRFRALPGVEAVGAISNLHLNPLSTSSSDFDIDGFEPPTDHGAFIAYRAAVEPEFFEVVGIEILRGRNFNDADRPDTQPLVIISEAMAGRCWTDGDAVGRRCGGAKTIPPGSSSAWRATRRCGRSAGRRATWSIAAVHAVADRRSEDADSTRSGTAGLNRATGVRKVSMAVGSRPKPGSTDCTC